MSSDLKKMQRKLCLLGLVKIPMIFYVRPKLISINEQQTKVKIKLRRRTKNHLGSMYFGALSVGADVAGGIMAFYFAEKRGLKISFAFKAVSGSFLQRAMSDVTFVCEAGNQIEAMVNKAKEIGDRVNEEVPVLAYDTEENLVAEFQMTLSIKVIN